MIKNLARMRKIRKKVGIIGCGNMGAAIARGIVRRGIIARNALFICEKDRKKRLSLCRSLRIPGVSTIGELLSKVKIVILAVKPQQLDEVAPVLRARLTKSHLLVSLLAGVSRATLQQKLGIGLRVVRAMPNLGLLAGAGVTALAGGTKEDRVVADAIFSACGNIIRIPERQFDVVTVISGSGPAYFFYLMELLERTGRRKGLSERVARLLAFKTAFGAATLACLSGNDPGILRKRVTSKGGTTEAAFSVLGGKAFRKLFDSALERALKRAKVLGRRL